MVNFTTKFRKLLKKIQLNVRRSEEPRHKSENKISRKLRIFENFQKCQLQNAVQRLVLSIFECGFWGIDEETCPEVPRTIKWTFFKNKISRKLRKTETLISENFREC